MDTPPTVAADSPDQVWDRPTRWFHWVNVALVFLLFVSGYLFKYRDTFQIQGLDAKMALKSAHSLIGYGFLIGLAIRFGWAFRGNQYARWRSIVPARDSLGRVGEELRRLRRRLPVHDRVRSPVSRWSATFMFLVMLLLAVTGLVRAATDLYHPPLGTIVARLVARPGVAPSAITWRTERELGDPDRLRRIARLKPAAGLPHTYGSWVLLGLVFLHIAGVTLTEVRQRSGLVSAMISGRFPS